MPSSISKVTKQIKKKKPGKLGALHENSRDAKRLRRANARDDKLNRVAAIRAKKTEPFRAYRSMRSPAKMQSLVEDFLKRDEDARAELQAKRRPGQPASAGQDLLQAKLDMEQKEYNSGFWMPDLEDESNVERLGHWNGEWNSLDTMVFVRITRAGKKYASQFPPHREN
ncbi:MAG: hypothetical protein Q9165_002351 [Trypethelium subeluteriae]